MTRGNKWLYGAGAALGVWQLIVIGVRAFANPWVWNVDQIAITVLVLLLIFGIARWGYIWAKRGAAGVKAERSDFLRRLSSCLLRRNFGWNILGWSAVAIALIMYFNISQ